MTTTTLAAGNPQDPKEMRRALLAIETALGSSEMGAALLAGSQEWIAEQLEERLGGAVGPLLDYVKGNWPTISASLAGFPLLDYMTTQHLRQHLRAVISLDDNGPLIQNRRSAAAFERLLSAASDSDPATSKAYWSVDKDLRNFRIAEREHVWLSGGDWE